MGDFGSKYSKSTPTKDLGYEPTTKKKIGRQKENYSNFQHAVYEIILWENKKLSAEAESYYNIDSEINENDIYYIDNMSLDEKKRKDKMT